MNPRVQAEHLVFTNATRAWSPRKVAGFQTVLASAGLSRADLERIEEQISDAAGGSADVERSQYFHLDDARRVVARRTAVRPDPEVIDLRRPAVTHAVVLGRQDLEGVEWDVFRILDGLPPIRDFRAWLAAQGGPGRAGRTLGFELSSSLPWLPGWTNAEFGPVRECLRARLDDPDPTAPPLLLVGGARPVEALLRGLMHLLPPPEREGLTFDSRAARVRYRGGAFRVMGLASEPSERGSHVVVQAERRAVGAPPVADPSDRPPAPKPGAGWLESWPGRRVVPSRPCAEVFREWLAHRGEEGSELAGTLRDAARMWGAIRTVVDGREYAGESVWEEELAEELLDVAWTEIGGRLGERLSRSMSGGRARICSGALLARRTASWLVAAALRSAEPDDEREKDWILDALEDVQPDQHAHLRRRWRRNGQGTRPEDEGMDRPGMDFPNPP